MLLRKCCNHPYLIEHLLDVKTGGASAGHQDTHEGWETAVNGQNVTRTEEKKTQSS